MTLDKISSKKSKDIDIDDLFKSFDTKKKKKKKKHKKNKSNKSINKKTNKKIKKKADLTADFFNLDDKQKKIIQDNAKYRYKRSFLNRINDSVNLDAKVRVDITDDTINNILGTVAGIITALFVKK